MKKSMPEVLAAHNSVHALVSQLSIKSTHIIGDIKFRNLAT